MPSLLAHGILQHALKPRHEKGRLRAGKLTMTAVIFAVLGGRYSANQDGQKKEAARYKPLPLLHVLDTVANENLPREN
jgi:hypothetical protein